MKAKRLNNRSAAEKKRLLYRGILYLCGTVAIITLGYFIAERIYTGKQSTQNEQDVQDERLADTAAITYEEQDYLPKTGLTTILLMGIDRDLDDNEKMISARNGGQADFLALMIIDSNNDTITRLQIDRDTMAEVTVLGILGNTVGTKSMQICLAHGFGDGREQSCQLTVEAVERLLYDIQIDAYLAVNLQGIGAINDALSGVCVPIEDDFSAYDETMVSGTVMRLTAQQAEYFVRKRIDIGEGTNESRMRRQSVYIVNAIKQASQLMEDDIDYADVLFDAAEPYMTTDMSRGRIINLMNSAKDYKVNTEPLTIPGEYGKGEDSFVEFHADEDALHQLVLDTFYETAHSTTSHDSVTIGD